ncbi:MAG: TolC family protein [Myxococcota bacterium]
MRGAIVSLLLLGPATAFGQSSNPPAELDGLSFERALELARQGTGNVLRAKDDLLLLDADKMSALAPVLPKIDLILQAAEQFSGDPIVEGRRVTLSTLVGGAVASGPFVDHAGQSMSQPNVLLQLNARQLLFDGGRWWTVLGRVKDIEAAKTSALGILENDLRASVAQVYYGHKKAEVAADAFAEQVALDEGQLVRIQAFLTAGRAKPADVAATLRNLAQDRAELARRRSAVRQAAHAFCIALALPPSTPFRLAIPAEVSTTTAAHSPALPPSRALIDRALTDRPEAANLEAQIAQAEKGVTIARADYYPSVSLGANYRRQSRRPDRVFNNPFENYYAGIDLTLNWNLFQGRATDAAVEQAEIALHKLQTQRSELARTIEGEVLDKIDAWELQNSLFSLALETLSAAEEAVRLGEGLYEQGRGTLLELRDAQLRRTEATQNARTARLEMEVARQALTRAVGSDPFAATPR